MEPALSLVVPTYNRKASLLRLLRALATLCDECAFEAIVIDDHSTDDTVACLQQFPAPYTLRLVEQDHGGPAAARNRGIAEAQGRIVLFLDDDVVPRPGLLAAHLAAHGSDDDAVVIGPMLPPLDWPRPAWIRWEEAQLQKQYTALEQGIYACTPRQFYTANASVFRARLLAAGGFDPSFRRAEDVELAFRLRAQGARFVFEPSATVEHYAARTFAAWRHTPYQYGRYDVIMERDKGFGILAAVRREAAGRHPLNRAAVRVCLGRPRVHRAAVAGLAGLARAADRAGIQRLASVALSAIFQLQYWQGVVDESSASVSPSSVLLANQVLA